MVSSTLGSSTITGWKRRSSAASFSMCLRYSSSVVAPMQCSSPRASIGLSRFEASIAPSAAPAPTTVCSSSMNRMISPSASCTSLSTALRRSSNSPRNFAPATSAPMSSAISRRFLSPSGTSPRNDALRQALDDRGLADARLADQHRVVLGAARQHLDDAANLVVAPDHRVELARRRELGQVAPVSLQRLVGRLGIRRGHALIAAHLLEHVHQLVVGESGLAQNSGSGARLVEHRDQHVLDRDVFVLELARFLLGPRQHAPEPLGHVGLARRRRRRR